MTYLKIKHRTKFFFLFSISILLLSILGCGQEENSTIEDNGKCWVELDGVFQEINPDENPMYQGGEIADFYKELYEYLKYPAEARENGVEGVCILNYQISKEGIIENVVAIQDPGEGIGEASEDALISAAEGVIFTPAIYNQVPVRVKKELDITFRLEG
jgi:hypothetical protein